MSLEEALRYAQVNLSDPVFALVTTTNAMSIYERGLHPSDLAVTLCGMSIIVLKNVYDYQRFDRQIRKEGWTTEILDEPYSWVAELWAHAHGDGLAYRICHERREDERE
jgi:hypothetical protein